MDAAPSLFNDVLEYFHFCVRLVELSGVFDVDDSGQLSQGEFVEGLVNFAGSTAIRRSRELYMMMTSLSL